MRTKEGFNLRTVCGENIIVPEGKENIDFSDIISMNETSAYLWKKLNGIDFTTDMLAEMLVEEYEVDKKEALNDAEELVCKWKEIGIIE